jgi:ferric-dicitrate binding protein FerR (iron transport regulator)
MKKNNYPILLEKFLRREATSEEVEQLIAWFCRNDTKEMLFKSYADKWDEASPQLDMKTQRDMLGKLKKQISEESKSIFARSWKRWVRSAAAVLIPLLVGAAVYALIDTPAKNISVKPMLVKVENGQKANLELPDGTRVWLNSASHLSYNGNFNKKDRVVNLEGEAYFEVAKDASRPFIVKTNDLSVRALGTCFDVKAYPNDNSVTTTLIEGKVSVGNSLGSTILVPNQKLTFDKKNRKFVKASVYDAELSGLWKNNELAFDSETLEEIALELERMYNIHVIFATDNIRQYRFSGKIKNNSLESVFQLISLTAPITYRVEDSVVVLRENVREKPLYHKMKVNR